MGCGNGRVWTTRGGRCGVWMWEWTSEQEEDVKVDRE